MLCSNCGKNEANVRYTRIINGEKTEYRLCEECAKKAGLEDIDFSMPIDFSNFLSDFFEDESLLPSFGKINELICPGCGLKFDDFVKNGKFGCSECYTTFEEKLNSIIKNLHGSSRHVGRRPKNIIAGKKADINQEAETEIDKNVSNKDSSEIKIDKLNKDLKQAIKEERYEDAAKIRDEIKSLGRRQKLKSL